MSSGRQSPGRPTQCTRRRTRNSDDDTLGTPPPATNPQKSSLSSPCTVPTQGRSIAIRPNLSTTQAESGRRSATASQDLMSREGEAIDPRANQQEDVGGSAILPNAGLTRSNTSNQRGPATAPKNISGTDLSTDHKDQIAEVIQSIIHPRERKKVLEKMLSKLIKSSGKNVVQKRNAVNLYRRSITQQDDEMEELERKKQERQRKKAEAETAKQERKAQEKPIGMREIPRIREKPRSQSIVQGRVVTSGFPLSAPTTAQTEQRTATGGSSVPSATTREATGPASPISQKELSEMVDCYFPRTQSEHTRDKRTRS
jgi:hypothetical protein